MVKTLSLDPSPSFVPSSELSLRRSTSFDIDGPRKRFCLSSRSCLLAPPAFPPRPPLELLDAMSGEVMLDPYSDSLNDAPGKSLCFPVAIVPSVISLTAR